MTSGPRSLPAKISALVSDVDGTLVTEDKVLTTRAQAAVAELHARGIIFTITSARPLRGMRMLLDPLRITVPIVGFNGGVIAKPDLSVIIEHVLASHIARRAVDMLNVRGVQCWVFAGQDWLVRDPDGPYVAHEQHAVEFEPTIVRDFGPGLDAARKIVGVSGDFELLAQCERDLSGECAGLASVSRSQPYYLDITHPRANKGAALLSLAKLLSIPPMEIAVIGDSPNDIAMFEQSGLSIAMGNAGPDVQRAADLQTGSNREDGFASAIERFILRNDGSNPQRVAAPTGICAP